MFAHFKFMVFIVITALLYFCGNSYPQNAEKIIKLKTLRVDLTGDGIKENIKLTIKLINYEHCAFLEIIDGKTGQNLFPDSLNPIGNIPIYPGNYKVINKMLYIPCGRLNSNPAFAEVFIYKYDNELNLFVEDRLVEVKVSGKNKNWEYVYKIVSLKSGKSYEAIRTIRRFAYYCKTGQIDKAQALTTVKLGNDTCLEENFQNDFYIHEIIFINNSKKIGSVIVKFPQIKIEQTLYISEDQKIIIGEDGGGR